MLPSDIRDGRVAYILGSVAPDQLTQDELVGRNESGARPINSGGVGWSEWALRQTK